MQTTIKYNTRPRSVKQQEGEDSAIAHSAQRVFAYVDGFNLYYGLREGGLRRSYWLNVRALAGNLLKPNQQLAFTKYFTARISGPKRGDPPALAAKLDAKRRRQTLFLDALATLPDFAIYEGHFLGKTTLCRNCGRSWRSDEEKMTDVRIATELLIDAFTDKYDTALLVSADSDLVPPILAVKHHFPRKRVVVAFPPRRVSEQLKRAAHAYFAIGEDKLRSSQFPDRVVTSSGFALKRPKSWR